MSTPIDLAIIVELIGYCREKVDLVRSNKESCAILAADLELIQEILMSLDPTEQLTAEKHKLPCVMNRLHNITTRAKILFDKCQSGKTLIKIRNIMRSTSIKQELQKLHSEIQLVVSMFGLVFHIKQNSAYSRGGITAPEIDESVFDEKNEQNMKATEDYYTDDEDEN